MCDAVGLHIFLPPCQRFLSNMPEASQRDDLHALQPRPQEVRSRLGPVDDVQRTGRGTVVQCSHLSKLFYLYIAIYL